MFSPSSVHFLSLTLSPKFLLSSFSSTFSSSSSSSDSSFFKVILIFILFYFYLSSLSLFPTIPSIAETSHTYPDPSLLSTPLPFSPLHKSVQQPVHQATTTAPCVCVSAVVSAAVFSSLTYNSRGRTLHHVPRVSVVIILQLTIKLAWLQV